MRQLIILVALAMAALPPAAARQSNPFLGAWNMSGTGPDTANVYWLEIKEEGERLSGTFLNRTSSPYVLTVVKIENNELIFQGDSSGKPNGPEYRARVENGKLVGHHTII